MKRDITKEKILIAAEELFAEKGFDKTSTASIAARAGVNSAMIFYYFESKENLLKSLITDKCLSYRQDRDAWINNDEIKMEEKRITPAILDGMLKSSLEFLQKSEDLFRILILEGLKKNTSNAEIFEINEIMVSDILRVLKSDDMPEQARIKLEIQEMLFLTLPMVIYALLKDKMTSYYQVDEKKIADWILGTMMKIYPQVFGNELGINVVEDKAI